MKVTIEFCGLVFAKFLCMRLDFCRYPFTPKIQSVYTQQSAQVGIQREKISFGTRFCDTQSLVCYTFVPVAAKRMSVALHDSRLFIGVEQADKFREEQKKFVFLPARKRNKRYIKILAAAEEKTLASTTQKLRVYSQNKTLSN